VCTVGSGLLGDTTCDSRLDAVGDTVSDDVR